MAINLQGSGSYLQGNNYSLQGSSPYNLQGSSPTLQGPPPPPAPKKITYGNTAATSPAKQQYMNSLGAYKYADDATVYGNYNGNSNYAFTSEAEFKNAGGSFDNVEVRQRPQSIAPATATQPTLTPPPPQPSALDIARQAYLKTFEPDTATTAAQTKYLDYINSAESGINALEGQGRGIPLNLVRGQQEKLGKQAETTAKRLQQDVELAQGNATITQEKAKAALDFANADISTNKPLELSSGATLVKFNPTTGKYETVAQGAVKPETLPASAQEYEYAKKNGYTGTYEQYQTEDANRKRSVTNINAGGLTNAQINTTKNQIAGAFDNEPVVKEYNVINEGYQFAKSLSNNTQNPSDDQGLIYAFAKAMDPGSVVREGEYATVQKYAQSWIESFGKGVEQAINGTGFLSSEARSNIKKTIETKFKASEANYQNVYNQYQKRLDTASSGGGNSLTDYSQAFTPYSTNSNNNDPLGIFN